MPERGRRCRPRACTAEVHHAVAAATTSASTPSATHCAGQVERLVGVATLQVAHHEARAPAAGPGPRRGARAPALAGRGVGQERDLARRRHATSLAGSRRRRRDGLISSRRRCGRSAAGAGRRTGRRAPTARPAGRGRRAPGRRRSRCRARPAPAGRRTSTEEDLAVAPGLVDPQPGGVVGDRRRVGLVDGQQVARQRRGRRPRGQPAADGCPVRRPASADQTTSPCRATRAGRTGRRR